MGLAAWTGTVAVRCRSSVVSKMTVCTTLVKIQMPDDGL